MTHIIPTYQHFDNLYNNTRKPPRSKKYAENQRPLRRVPESWLMLQKDANSYVVKINRTEVARYYPPNEQGISEVAIRGLYATYDIHLMYQFTRIYSCMPLTTTTGEVVKVPLNPHYKDQEQDFSAVLCFNSSDQLVVEESWHSDVYRFASTDEDKAKRKALKAQLEAYITLQMFKLPTLKANAKVDADQGSPFGEEKLNNSVRLEINSLFGAFTGDISQVPEALNTPRFAQLFDEVSQDAFNMLASKRVYNDGAYNSGSLFWKAQGYYGTKHPDEKADAEEKINDIINAITPDDHKKSLIARLMKYANLGKGSQKVALPQFSNTLPNRFHF
jgi:hypothetical protein